MSGVWDNGGHCRTDPFWECGGASGDVGDHLSGSSICILRFLARSRVQPVAASIPPAKSFRFIRLGRLFTPAGGGTAKAEVPRCILLETRAHRQAGILATVIRGSSDMWLVWGRVQLAAPPSHSFLRLELPRP